MTTRAPKTHPPGPRVISHHPSPTAPAQADVAAAGTDVKAVVDPNAFGTVRVHSRGIAGAGGIATAQGHVATTGQRRALGAAAGNGAGVNGQTVVNVDVAKTVAIAVSSQDHVTGIGAEGLGDGVAVNVVARDQSNLGAGLGTGQVVLEPHNAAIHRDRTGCGQRC